MSLDTQDKSYIVSVITQNNEVIFKRFKKESEDNRVSFKKDMEQITGAYHELVRDEIKKVVELVRDRPTREEVREIVIEEARPIVQEEIHRLVMPNFREIHTKINSISSELRSVTKNHEKRITRLEAASAH